MQNPSEFPVKSSLHLRNKHRDRYDFEQLILALPELAPFVMMGQFKEQTIDFANPEAVKALNKAILAHFYKINFWDIPAHFLCPPIPSRADYVHYLADILAESNAGSVPRGASIKCLDIGVGANCVYPIVGRQTYGWSFVGSDIDPVAIKSATNIVNFNQNLKNGIVCRLQHSPNQYFEDIIKPNEYFDLTICNPPFHANVDEAKASNARKVSNLTGQKVKTGVLNFGGQQSELCCEGGEAQFVWQMIKESARFAQNVCWFSTLVSKKENLANIFKTLETVKAVDKRVIEMRQGNKISRLVAWTFLTDTERHDWMAKKSKTK